jgi:hypothetical protein
MIGCGFARNQGEFFRCSLRSKNVQILHRFCARSQNKKESKKTHFTHFNCRNKIRSATSYICEEEDNKKQIRRVNKFIKNRSIDLRSFETPYDV